MTPETEAAAFTPLQVYQAAIYQYQEKSAELLERYQDDWQAGRGSKWRAERDKLVASKPEAP